MHVLFLPAQVTCMSLLSVQTRSTLTLAGTGAPVTNLTQDPNVYGGYISPTGQLYSNSNARLPTSWRFPLHKLTLTWISNWPMVFVLA